MAISDVITRATSRYNPNTKTEGQVTRSDILEVLEFYKSYDNERTNVGAFLDQLPFVTQVMKDSILSDLASYEVSYERE